MSHLPSYLFEEIYFNKTVVPRVPYCIGVWGCCSVAMITEIGNLHFYHQKEEKKAYRISEQNSLLDQIPKVGARKAGKDEGNDDKQ